MMLEKTRESPIDRKEIQKDLQPFLKERTN